MKESDRIKKAIRTTRPLYEKVKPVLSTGVPLMNLAISGSSEAAFPLGGYIYFVGDSSSGKTFFEMSTLAEAAINPLFDNHTLVFDNVENGALMDLNKFYPPLVGRLRPPRGTPKSPRYSRTIEEFYYNLDDLLKEGPVVYALDSMDALRSFADDDKFEEDKAAFRKGKQIKGSYGMAKAKINSGLIKRVADKLVSTGSLLLVISQTRDKINTPFPMKTRSGGHALKFYAQVELWTSIKGDITKTVFKKERVVGSTIQVDVRKNRIQGWDGKVLVPFYRSLGWDATGSSVDFLIEERRWGKPEKERGEKDDDEDDKKKKGKGLIYSPEFSFTGKREQLIKRIEDEDGEDELTEILKTVWDEIEEGCQVDRKPRYKE